MNTATAKTLLAAHDIAIRDAINARDAIDSCCSPEWRAAHVAAGAACKAKDAEIARLAGLTWDDGRNAMEMALYGRLLRRHADPVMVTWTDLQARRAA